MPDPPSSAPPPPSPARDAPVVGTDVLGRPFTPAEKAYFERLLRKHGFLAARAVASKFAHSKARTRAEAEDILGRVMLRLVRQGWDPAEVPLVKRLCRLVFSEWTHERAERKVARAAEKAFVEEMAGVENLHTMAPDEAAEARARLEAERARAEANLERLRQVFREADDDVNLAWLDYTQRGIESLQEMALLDRRDVGEFYRAADRRKRHVERLILAGKGTTFKEKP